jgi:hypothetical protein
LRKKQEGNNLFWGNKKGDSQEITLRMNLRGLAQGLTPVIPATWELEIRRITI